jgi:hypothetical protein
MGSTPGCSKKRRSSMARTAWRMRSGITSATARRFHARPGRATLTPARRGSAVP